MRVYLNLSFLVFFIFSCSNRNNGIKPELKEVTESVYASVVIQPDSLYQAYAIVSGILDSNIVEEGDLVEKGQSLIQITNNTPKLNTENAKLTLDLARENYNGRTAILLGIEDEIAAANLKFKNDSVNYFRQKSLWEQQIGSKTEYDSKELNYRLSFNSLNLLKSRYDRTKNELATTLKRAENNYRSSQISTKDFTIVSKIAGKVYALYKNPGELVNTLEPLASVGSENNFIIEMLVDEMDIVKVAKNQKVLLNLDAYSNKIYIAHISRILPQKDERNQTFTVEALFEEKPDVLYPGLSGEASIIIAVKSNVLTIPKYYLNDGNMVKTDDGLIPIEIGIQNLEFVEVISGLDENTTIYK
jgi:multidrug efflux pump subunit AcrA (membrane-fusion protein)